VVGALAKEEVAPDAMIRLMIGRDLKSLYIAPKTAPGASTLEIDGLRTSAYPHQAVSLAVRSGEILGLAGLVGSGRTELARAIFGIDAPLGGVLRQDGAPIVIGSPRAAIDRGIYLVPEDRKRSSLLLDLSLAQNISLPDLRSYARRAIVSGRGEHANAEQQRQRLNIKTTSVASEVGTLSGGNQQKVVLARWLSMDPRLVIFDEPTRGIDVGAKSEIYKLLNSLAQQGKAIIVISSELSEILRLSHRIAVMCEGRLTGILPGGAGTSQEEVMYLATQRESAMQPVGAET
jgi:ribose transport system ATP-binding protein